MKKKYFYYILCFICPILGLFLISTFVGFIPFGKHTFNVFDAYYQYAPILEEYTYKLKTGSSLLFTLHGGMGVNFLSIINLYAGSPFNLLGIFFKRENIYIFFTILIYIKLGLSGLFMNVYLNHRNTKYKYTVWNLMFSFIYALSGYITVYLMHIMWLDAYYLLPLIILGLDNLIDDKKCILYVLMLSLTIMINYYMAFMICIFLVIYFLYYTLINEKLKKDVIKRFILYSILASLIGMIVILPSLVSLFMGRFTSFKLKNLFKIQNFTLFSLPYNFTIGSFIINDNYNFGSNNIFCTLFVLVLVIYFFFNKNVKLKEKKVSLGVIIFFIVSFSFNFLDFSWNMLQAPIWWSHRYQFLFSFFLILIAYKSFCNFDNRNLGSIKALIVIIFAILVIASLSYKLKGLMLDDTYIYFMFISLGLFFIYMFFIKPKYIFILLVLLEIGLNTYHNLDVNKGRIYEELKTSYQEKKELVDKIPEKDKWRSTIISNGYANEGFLYGFNSVELFSSTYNSKGKYFIDNINVSNKDVNQQKFYIYNPAVLSLIGVKYLIGESNYYKCQEKICVNENALPFGYQVPESFLDIKLSEDYIRNINNIYSGLLGKKINLFNTLSEDNIEIIDMEYSKDKGLYDIGSNPKIKIKYQAKKREMVIFNDIKIASSGIIDFKINGKNKELHNKETDNLVILEAGDILEVNYIYDESLIYKFNDYLFSFLDLDTYEEKIKEIKDKTNWETIIDNKNILKGSINTSDGYVMLSIPYDKGLSIKIDGKEVNYKEAIDTFVAFKVSKGSHIIEVNYRPKGLILGGLISLISLIIFGGIIYKQQKNV